MDPSSYLLSTPELDYEGWKDALRPDWGRYNPEAIKPETFTGRACRRSVCGFMAKDVSCNAHRVERTQRDTRLDDMDHYYAVFQVAGGSTMIQNDQAVKLAVGDVAFVDSARPVTYVSENGYGQWFSLQLPRRSLVSHLGFEPQYSFCGRSETRTARLLFQLILDAVHVRFRRPPRPSPICSWRSMISSAHYLRSPICRLSPLIPTSFSHASAVS
jgi:AraC family transcriptional regulator, positive regulator of tynA and feaB